jgi:outer membrane protein OmpA-like peptidoglycan-associated protein
MKNIRIYLSQALLITLLMPTLSLAQKQKTMNHPVFGAYFPRLADNIDPLIEGELEIRPDANNIRKAWIFNFVVEGPVLAIMSTDNPDGNRIYDIPAQRIGGKSFPSGGLNFTFDNSEKSSIILSIGDDKYEISFLGDKLDNRTVSAYSSKKTPIIETIEEPKNKQPTKLPKESTIPAPENNPVKWEGGEVKTGEKIVLKNVNFEITQAILLPESYPELEKLAKWMMREKTSKIRLEGHTDIIGDSKSNLELSEKRVQAVKNYLISKGIEAVRIKTQGFGDTRPLVKNGTTEERKSNRRVEFTLLEK